MRTVEALPGERHDYRDPDSGCRVVRLTGAVGHSHLLYFTCDGWTGDGRYLVIASERSWCGNQLWAVDLLDGSLLRLTDLPAGSAPDHVFTYASLDPAGRRLAYWSGGELMVQDLTSGRRQVVHASEGTVHGTSWTADGTRILTCCSEGGEPGTGASTGDRLGWLRDPPMSQVLAVDAGGAGARVVHEERWLVTHVNASPTDPDLFTFCHEGPWLEVAHRIWAMHLSGGAPWPAVPRDPAWGIGHEYWCQDGRTIGWHARHRDSTWRHAAGFADLIAGTWWQAELAVPTHHAVALDDRRVYLDGTRASGGQLLVVERVGDTWSAPRVLCRHDASRHHHRAHVHPRPRRDGRSLAFTSDRRGYCDVYLAEVPDRLADLPVYGGAPRRYYWE